MEHREKERETEAGSAGQRLIWRLSACRRRDLCYELTEPTICHAYARHKSQPTDNAESELWVPITEHQNGA